MRAAILSHARHVITVIATGPVSFFGKRYYGRRYFGKRYFG